MLGRVAASNRTRDRDASDPKPTIPPCRRRSRQPVRGDICRCWSSHSRCWTTELGRPKVWAPKFPPRSPTLHVTPALPKPTIPPCRRRSRRPARGIEVVAAPTAWRLDGRSRQSKARRREIARRRWPERHRRRRCRSRRFGHAVAVHVGQLARKGSLLLQPPAVRTRRSREVQRLAGAKLPAAGGERTMTPASPKPTISAMPSPFTSASSRGKVVAAPTASRLDAPNWLERMLVGAEVPTAGGQRHGYPALPKPTISAMPSPFTSASSRGKGRCCPNRRRHSERPTRLMRALPRETR